MSQMIPVADGVELFVEDAGSGEPVVFIPGWTCTTRFFKHQMPHVAATRRFVAYAPRSHGRSTKTLEGNTFTERARDLAALLEALDLTDVTLVGWSFGAYDALAYLRDHGFERTGRLVICDEPPKAPIEEDGQWGEFPPPPDARLGVVRPALDDRLGFWPAYAQSMIGVDEDQTPETNPEIAEIVAEGMLTPDAAAYTSLFDGAHSDFTDIAAEAAHTIPTLVMAREDWADDAERWTTTHMPGADFERITLHMGFWAHPTEFNATLDGFLDRR